MMVSAISSGLPTRLSGTVAAKYSLLCYFSGIASGMSARAAFAQSTSFCTAGAPLRPIAPTTSPFTLMGNPPPHAATYSSTTACFARSRIEQPCLFPLGRRYQGVSPSSSRVQKESRMFNEELRVHVVRAVIGVGVDDQLRIRHVLLHDERVHRGHNHVVTAVQDECWLLDRLQIVVGPLLLDAPLAH